MMPLSCLRMSILIERRRAGLSEKDALELEEHLQSCASCSRTARDWDRLIRLKETKPTELRPSIRNRIIERTFDAKAPAPRPSRTRVPIALAVSGVLAAVGAFLIVRARPNEEPAVEAVKEPIAARPIVRKEVASEREFVAPKIERLTFAHAKVRLGPDTDFRWNAEDATLELIEGRLAVDVDPAPRRLFRVATSSFWVLMLGGEFSVDEQGIEVVRGSARVLAKDGRLLAKVRKGNEWKRPAADLRTKTRDKRHRPPTVSLDRIAWLEEAKRALADGQIDRARERIDSVLAEDPTRREEAEALTLLAECELVSGERASAVDLYQKVGEQFSDLAAGETALFAAARLEAEVGNASSAKRLLKVYLERHPDGRFRAEAERQMELLQ